MNWRSKARDVALCAMMAAMLELGKMALNAIANVEVVTLLILLFSRRFGWRIFPSVFVFVGMEFMIFGLGMWSICYLYVWPLLATLGYLLRQHDQPLFWALLAGFYGLFFGALCSITSLFIGGPAFALAWWISGVPYDLIHAVANFTIVFFLWKPLDSLLRRLA